MADLNQESQKPRRARGPARPPQSGGPSIWMQLAMAFAVFLVLSAGYSLVRQYVVSEAETVPLSQIASDVAAGKIESLLVEGDAITATYADETKKKSRKETEASLTETLANYQVSQEQIGAVKIEIKDEGGARFWFLTLAPLMVPVLLLFGIIWYLSRQMRGAGMQAFTFGRSMARLTSPEDQVQRVTFADVAGAKEAKEELTEIVDFLKNPKKFIQIGARIPKGVLLMGAAGTGKTLLARAVAGESNVPFFSISGSEFVEMFVGVGASRVRDTFQVAKKASPSILFIDEIDAIGRVRGTGVGGGNDEREQTLNQLLVEMDGFEGTAGVIVIAATTRPDVLDPALLRPGRFDRQVVVDAPDVKGREGILRVHTRKIPLAGDVRLEVLARGTPGLSGADLANLVNEAALLAARTNKTQVNHEDFEAAKDKVMLGVERRSLVLTEDERRLTAYYEAGHAIVSLKIPGMDPIHKITIVPRGRALGLTA